MAEDVTLTKHPPLKPPEIGVAGQRAPDEPVDDSVSIFTIEELDFYYGHYLALRQVNLFVPPNQITALIGPSGCGKTTLLRCFNRMNDLIPGTRVDGKIRFHAEDLYGPNVDPIEVRRRIGMVFQRANPFPKSIYDNVAFGPKVNGFPRRKISDLVEESLRRAALWEEVKDKLSNSGFVSPGPSPSDPR